MDYKQPLPRKSRHANIVQEIGMRIVSGGLPSGEKLPHESAICEEYAVSRPVVREAIRVLTAKGLVRSTPRVGTVVRPRQDWHMLDPDVLYWLVESTPHSEFFSSLVNVRRIIEPAVCALAATTATAEDLQAIEQAYEQMEAAGNHAEMLQPDLDFHRCIAEATHNDLLVYLSNMLSIALRESIRFSSNRPNLQALTLPRHKAILTAIQNRDALGAQQASIVQLDDTRVALDTVLNRLTTL